MFGFLPYWEVNGAATRLDYDVLSTIAYFSVGVNGKGGLKKRDPDGTLTTGWGGWTSSGMTRVINAAHANGTRVVLTVTRVRLDDEPGPTSRRRSSAAAPRAGRSPARSWRPSAIVAPTA